MPPRGRAPRRRSRPSAAGSPPRRVPRRERTPALSQPHPCRLVCPAMPLFRSKAEDKVRAAGYDPARLPPGQYLTETWPVLHAGDVAHVDVATGTLRIFGEVEEEVTLGYEQLRALPATEVTTDIHCVTRWSRFDAGFRGVHWRELAKLCRPQPSAHFAFVYAEAASTENIP